MLLVILRDIDVQRQLDKLLRQRRFRMGKDFANTVFLNQFTLDDHRDLVANTLHHVHLIVNQQNGEAETTVNIFQQLKDRAGDSAELFLSAGEVSGPSVMLVG